jgi:hypothetical protein
MSSRRAIAEMTAEQAPCGLPRSCPLLRPRWGRASAGSGSSTGASSAELPEQWQFISTLAPAGALFREGRYMGSREISTVGNGGS